MNNNYSNTIIGSGFIAKNFDKHAEFFKKQGICLYAAGVSNSLCRDKNLLEIDKKRIFDFRNQIDNKKILLYLSTCSIQDPSRNQNPYVINKLEIENFIKKNFRNFFIVRLPEVVGKNSNSNTLINFFFNKIKNNETFELWDQASRNLIDISDVKKILIDLLKNKKYLNSTINIAHPKNCTAVYIVKTIEEITQRKARYNLVNKGETNWKIDISAIIDSIKNCDIKFDELYLKNILKKYFT